MYTKNTEPVDKEFDGLQLHVFMLSVTAEEIVNDLIAETKTSIMKLGELLKGSIVHRRIINDYDKYIRQYAKDEFQERIMRAIIFEEQVHEWPPFIEGQLEEMGFGDTVGLSQISVKNWSKKYGSNRRELLDPRNNIRIMRRHLDAVEKKAEEKGMRRTPENSGSLWNNHNTTTVTEYGNRVKEYEEMFSRYAEEKKRREEEAAIARAEEEAKREAEKIRDKEEEERIQKKEAGKKKAKEQRDKETNYGPNQRQSVSWAEKRNEESTTYRDSGYDIQLTRIVPEKPKRSSDDGGGGDGARGGGGDEGRGGGETDGDRILPIQKGGPLRLP